LCAQHVWAGRVGLAACSDASVLPIECFVVRIEGRTSLVGGVEADKERFLPQTVDRVCLFGRVSAEDSAARDGLVPCADDALCQEVALREMRENCLVFGEKAELFHLLENSFMVVGDYLSLRVVSLYIATARQMMLQIHRNE
jgi:hypothetical protein